jgi:hypothetical protein
MNDDELLSQNLDLPGENNPATPKNKTSFRKYLRPLILILVAAIVLGAGFFIWQAYDSDDSADQDHATIPSDEDTPQASNSDVVSGVIPEPPGIETVRTRQPRTEISHPSHWSLIEEGGAVVLESPAFDFVDTSGSETNGVFRIIIRQGATPSESEYFGRGVAAAMSEPLTYTDPATGQRDTTNLSFFGLDSGANIGFFLVAGNFTLTPGDTLGPDFANEPEDYIIAGGYATANQAEGIATIPVAVDFFKSTNAYDQAIDIIKSLKLL